MSRKERTIGNAIRCIRVVAVASALVLIASSAMAAGLQVTKSCPMFVTEGDPYTCSFLVTNIDPDMQPITGLSVTEQHPLPGGAVMGVSCTQGMPPVAVTTLQPGASCGGTLMLTAPACTAGPFQDVDEIIATATSPIGTSGSTTNGPLVSCLREPCGFLVIDEDSIDNGNPPNFFSDVDVNDHIAEIGVRSELPFFAANEGLSIDLWTGTVGDEGWFALKTIPTKWDTAGPTTDGLLNFWLAGKGLGSGKNREKFLDKIPDVTPLRADGLKMLEGECICAVVYDSDISINYDPLNGSLKGANLGVVAFTVNTVTQLFGQSSGSLPVVNITIEDADEICTFPLGLFTDAPVPESSSEPYDIVPD